jgi:hypothetical protein
MVSRLRFIGSMALGAILVTLTLLSQSAAWAAPSPSPSPTVIPSLTVTPTPTPAPLISAPGADSYWFIGAIVVGVALLGVGVVAANGWGAYQWRKTVTSSITKGEYSPADTEKLLTLVREPPGVRGLTRGLIALLIVVLTALALAVTIISAAPDASDLRKTIVTSLLSVLAALAGFYFGSRTAQTSTSDAAGGSNPAATPTVPPDTNADAGATVAPDTTALADVKAEAGNTDTGTR